MSTVNRRNEIIQFLKELTNLCDKYDVTFFAESADVILYDNKKESLGFIGSFGTAPFKSEFIMYDWD